ncbi:hypothetical protein ACPXCE_14080 [Streptomyces sp. DT24]|uniref:hypothetical protein n=1 Tax=Streptomyces sp. DT24 TaxID=3416520 RepID=UPI003CF21520
MTGSEVKAAVDWLVSVALDPAACRWAWERDPAGIVLLPAGRRWDVLVLPEGLGRPTLDVLTRFAGRPGPVLGDASGARTGFFVAPGAADRWVGTGTRGVGAGTWIAVPHPGRAVAPYPGRTAAPYPGRTAAPHPGRSVGPAGAGVRWLVPPDGSGALTDVARLELAMHEAAAVTATGHGDPHTGRPRGAGEPRRPWSGGPGGRDEEGRLP